MGLFSNQFANVVEWEEYRDDLLFWKWTNREIKKDSRLIIKPGQDAIFLYNGAVEGIFTESGSYTIDSDIIPFLSTLKGFKFGFNSGLRAEVLFINTKEFTCNWGTSSPIRLQAPGLPGGLPYFIQCVLRPMSIRSRFIHGNYHILIWKYNGKLAHCPVSPVYIFRLAHPDLKSIAKEIVCSLWIAIFFCGSIDLL